MVKVKLLKIDKIDPSVNTKGQVQFAYSDAYIRKNLIGAITMINGDECIRDGWSEKEIKKYCAENNLKICTIVCIHEIPQIWNVVVDDTVRQLLDELD